MIQEVEDLGKLDNTLIIYISGDNGTSAEGTILGTTFDLAAIQSIDMNSALIVFGSLFSGTLLGPLNIIALTRSYCPRCSRALRIGALEILIMPSSG